MSEEGLPSAARIRRISFVLYRDISASTRSWISTLGFEPILILSFGSLLNSVSNNLTIYKQFLSMRVLLALCGENSKDFFCIIPRYKRFNTVLDLYPRGKVKMKTTHTDIRAILEERYDLIISRSTLKRSLSD
jgi:hypothetical protein